MLNNTSMNRVFVYGTLKSGQPNYFRLMDPDSGSAKFVNQGKTMEKYPLVIERLYNLPCLLHVPGTGTNVKGEIYEVDEKKMRFLDYFEDHPEMYKRTLISVEHQNSVETQSSVTDSHSNSPHTENQPNTSSQCWCYFYNDRDGSLKDLPRLDNYDSKGDHGLEYDSSLDAEFDK
ncbi:gamma-glutamylaminecyclotransferase-like [Saccostrea echinata]|uniref:gamma-glutamylaminecyclotransferase-like n=1 Tax=Saccostrea echinata TaxID=191078 RepID=UPI002A839B51|nr:gamma-glutamylaminecyclotransferase-like [Saccostrea echinata]